jgi:murein DD-endopeptidase MepM/ murein hydrolase activator NlpD
MAPYSAISQASSGNDQDRVEFVVNHYLDLPTLTSTLDEGVLSHIEVKNESGGAGGPANGSDGNRHYTVQLGDNLSIIATQFNVAIDVLVAGNKDLENAQIINPGQVLTIPSVTPSEEELAAARKKLVLPILVPTVTTQYNSPVSRATVSVSHDSSYILPIPYTYKSQGFSLGYHNGIDMVAPFGTPVVATKSGCIISAGGGWNGGYGNLVIEDLGGGITARYAHLSAIAPSIYDGACIAQGALIGKEGTTGNSTGPHLHFELRANGTPFDPGM